MWLERRLDECRELILRTLEGARVPLACRCQLLQQLAAVVSFQQGMEYLDEAAELCHRMRGLAPHSEQLDRIENKNALLRHQLIKEQGEDETTEGDEEITVDDGKAAAAKDELMRDGEENQDPQQQSDLETEGVELGNISLG